jgi:predicted small lipoprotein YifL
MRALVTISVVAAATLVSLTGCGRHRPTGLRSSFSPAPVANTETSAGQPHRSSHVPHRGVRPPAPSYGLVAVHDPGRVTGALVGPCRPRDHGMLPDPSCTPGAFDPAVTQADVGSTICTPGYSSSVRPPESQTEAFKWNVAEPAYGQHEISGELDHLVPLELGGANDARNLWVQAGPIPNPKDQVEDALHQAVCAGRIPLRVAQREIAGNWITTAEALGITVTEPTTPPPTSGSAFCTATASYSSRYADWDVVVHSNQPDTSVTASSGSYAHSWHTDRNGYAVVYLRGPAPGQPITVTVGAARCSATAA